MVGYKTRRWDLNRTDLGFNSGPITSSPYDLGHQPVSQTEELVKIREKGRPFQLTMCTWKKLSKS